eukprot:m51a1_g10680 hypothetical protein (421) ;mRNA; r:75737-84216
MHKGVESKLVSLGLGALCVGFTLGLLVISVVAWHVLDGPVMCSKPHGDHVHPAQQISISALPAHAATCKLPGCTAEVYPGYGFCSRAHAQQHALFYSQAPPSSSAPPLGARTRQKTGASTYSPAYVPGSGALGQLCAGAALPADAAPAVPPVAPLVPAALDCPVLPLGLRGPARSALRSSDLSSSSSMSSMSSMPSWADAPAAPPPPPVAPLPVVAGWGVARAPDGMPYWYNAATWETSWVPPAEPASAARAAGAVAVPFPQLPREGAGRVVFGGAAEAFRELSNVAEGFAVAVNGVEWPSAEHFFQAQKFPHLPTVAEVIRTGIASPLSVLSFARELDALKRPDWEAVEMQVMEAALRAKFSQHESLARLLVYTHPHQLVESGPVGSFWGCGPDRAGKNMLGVCLCRLRDALMKQQCLQ